MPETPRFAMPLLDAAQAQKHVTVNEALSRADALAAGRVETRGLTVPPPAADGDVHIVGAGATGDWAGQDGALAIRLNGGWDFAAPWEGMSVWLADGRLSLTHDGGAWIEGRIGGASGAAATLCRVVETDQALSGQNTSTAPIIPDKAIVLGVTGRVLSAITGASAWSIGVSGSPDRYGSGYGVAAGSFAQGVTGQPQAYYGATPLRITASGGTFSGGTVRLAVHLLEISPPAAV